MDYTFLTIVFILCIVAFCIYHLRKEKLNADFQNAQQNEKNNIILKLSGLKGKQNRVRPIGDCTIDLFLTENRLYIQTFLEIDQTYPPHPLILTREQIDGHKKCKLMLINMNSYNDCMRFRFIGTSKIWPDEICVYDLTSEQKQIIDSVIKSKEDLSQLYVYYLEKSSE